MRNPSGFTMEVLTRSGRAAAVEFRIVADAVEVWHHGYRSAVLDRSLLGDWLAEPGRPLVVDEVAFSLDRMVDSDGRVAVTLPDVVEWTLDPGVLAGLRTTLAQESDTPARQLRTSGGRVRQH